MSTISGLGGTNRIWDSGPGARRAEQEARRFAKADGDGSGGVDAAELAAMLEQGGQSADVDSAALLQQMDGDGSLSGDELGQGLRELMPPPASTLEFAQGRGPAGGGDEAFATMDADGDGQLSKAEFEAARSPQAAPGAGGPPPAPPGGSGGTGATDATAASGFDPLDVNQDGVVSELERLAGQLKELANTEAGDDGQGLNSQVAALAQKLYDQISRNWLQPAASAPAGQIDTSA
ncbi:MAG: hypothetical protein QM788_14540 [Roseateles sp.]|uniref:hypothetical protein n=1 Tax=Roseateles sp. TaxID=1971397 RepID=UPI0039EA8E74